MPLRLLVLPILAFLAACASAPGADVANQAPQAVEVAEAPPPPPPVSERPFPAESLYPLLSAEFALRRREYESALGQYMTLAPELRDAGISAHTTRLAQYLNREPEALEAALLWTELAPESVEANSTAANLLVRRGRTLEAAPLVAAIARAGEDANFPMLLSGFRRLPPEQQSQMVTAINSYAAEMPDNTQLMLTQALLLEELGKPDASLEKLQQVFANEPYQAQALLVEARLLTAAGSRRPFRRIESALEAQPENTRLRLQYARLLTQDDIDGAKEQFEILNANAPQDADLLFSLALINREMDDPGAAKQYLKEMLALGERTDEANYYLGRLAEDEGEPQQAISYYQKVMTGRDYLSAKQRIGRILIEDGELEKSQAHFASLRAANPEQREQFFAIEAELLSNADQLDSSLALLNLGLEEYPDSTALLYSRSMVGEKQNDLVLMESDLRQILAREPDNATALNALGYTLANRTDRYDEALELISRALELQPGEPAILDSMGWVLYRQGRYDESITYLRQAFAEFPDPEVAAHLGEVLWVTGDTEAALKIWGDALDEDPQHKVLTATLERLGITALTSASP
ncbi:tetratricopeptide repeat protein [Halioglobus pacificus]|uniref:Tetratricopeptide repeat protein n=1 Tax=Parahalioglobus pacificus TaxID=930806 RepID=A0A919CI98_9GAMM|nr:tetratricopeptide repeat protein [Halioglobus pacificus]GHD25660.1 hypothetical protein GCM10007053_01750 [Halioglobus pacificus]